MLILHKNIHSDPSFELSCQDSSDEGSQHMVSKRNKQNYPSVIIKYSLLSKALKASTFNLFIHLLVSVIQCVESECKGRNSLNNLRLLSRSILALVLKFPPPNAARDVERFLENIQNLQLTVKDAITEVERMLKKGWLIFSKVVIYSIIKLTSPFSTNAGHQKNSC